MKNILSGLALVLMLPASTSWADKLVIAGRDGAYGQALKIAAAAYREKHPDVEFEQLELNGSGLLEKVTIAMREKSSAYDVIMLDDPWAPEFMSKGWLANLDTLGGGVDDDFVATTRNVARHPVGTGAYFAVPFVGNVEMFAYNKDILAQHGLAAPQKWTDVLAAAKTISESGKGPSGLVFRGKKANPIVTGFLPILWAYGGDVINADGQAVLDSQNANAALGMFLELAKYAPKGVETYDATEVRDALQQGSTAISIEVWPAWVPSMDDPKTSKVPGQVEVMPAPGQNAGSTPMLGSWLVAVPESSANKERARDFINFLTSASMQKRLALETGNPPTRASVYADPEILAAYRWYPAQYAALQIAKPRPRTEKWAKIEAIIGDYLQLALIGEMKPADALAEANQRIADAIAN
ncbi:ABC transporter substrate-binding protein [Aminobacter sp. UC22_36]|uniref:ABC transporter substrate-binding protein n=1 Tax=Aminobacter sp. UC22_36 TaxID=3374549 RepID=UPI0037566C8D